MHRLPGPETPQLKIHEPVYRFELGLQILEPRIVFAFELLDQRVVLCLMSVDLFLEQVGAVLQVSPNVTHDCPLVN